MRRGRDLPLNGRLVTMPPDTKRHRESHLRDICFGAGRKWRILPWEPWSVTRSCSRKNPTYPRIGPTIRTSSGRRQVSRRSMAVEGPKLPATATPAACPAHTGHPPRPSPRLAAPSPDARTPAPSHGPRDHHQPEVRVPRPRPRHCRAARHARQACRPAPLIDLDTNVVATMMRTAPEPAVVTANAVSQTCCSPISAATSWTSTAPPPVPPPHSAPCASAAAASSTRGTPRSPASSSRGAPRWPRGTPGTSPT